MEDHLSSLDAVHTTSIPLWIDFGLAMVHISMYCRIIVVVVFIVFALSFLVIVVLLLALFFLLWC
jgi:hypothetical protein